MLVQYLIYKFDTFDSARHIEHNQKKDIVRQTLWQERQEKLLSLNISVLSLSHDID